jgi:hypothetical protein
MSADGILIWPTTVIFVRLWITDGRTMSEFRDFDVDRGREMRRRYRRSKMAAFRFLFSKATRLFTVSSAWYLPDVPTLPLLTGAGQENS